MTLDDVPAAERLSDAAFFALDVANRRASDPEPEHRDEERRAAWSDRCRHFVTTAPGGCWVAEDEEGMVGMATSHLRESIWALATFAVRPGSQGRGIGAQLMDRVTAYAAGAPRWMLCASTDPQAVRRYHYAGFDLHPYVHFRGRPDRSALPSVPGLRDASADDIELLDEVDRAARGAARPVDHEAMLKSWRLVVDREGRGYTYLRPPGDVAVLAATDEDTARRLAWDALGSAEGDVRFGRITPGMRWAMDIGMAARLSLRPGGFLGLRGMAPPPTYLPDGVFL